MQIPPFWHGCVVFFFVFLARVVRFSTLSFCASRQCLSCLFPGYLLAEAAAAIGFLWSFDVYPFPIKLGEVREKARFCFLCAELLFLSVKKKKKKEKKKRFCSWVPSFDSSVYFLL